jgi:GH15 family glucan-1,4-alpha-glucosidase
VALARAREALVDDPAGPSRRRVRRRPYTAACGSAELDAALLILPLLEPASSARVVGTSDAVRRQLSASGPLLYRYPPGSHGLTGGEGAFRPRSFWLVQALACTGRREEAEALLDQLLALGGPLGLFGEEIDPATGEHLGNYPQALTHAALVQAVFALDYGSATRLPARIRSC